ncbi:MAG: FAD-dependent oxidoreductase [Polyangiaceae bacterium]
MKTEAARVLVIGSGIAGTAAAWSAARAGAKVTLVSAGAGASMLASGAVDDIPWEDVLRASRISRTDPRARPLSRDVLDFVEALGAWRVVDDGEPLSLLATCAGVVRRARGHDRSVLDLSTLRPGLVVVPRADRAGWDADALSDGYGADSTARRRGLVFTSLQVPLVRYEGEHRLSDLDLAARHDDPVRIAWLATRLREAIGRTAHKPVGVLLGPWLGLSEPRAAELTAAMGIPCGEAISGSGSPAGMRFANARDRLFASIGVDVVTARVERLRLDADDEGRPSVDVEGEEEPRSFDRVVLACGGLAGGGLVYDPLDTHAGADMPEKYGPSFRLSFEVTAALEDEVPYLAAGGARIGVVGSMFGPDLDASGWPSPGRAGRLEMVGVACDAEGVCGPRAAVAGDAMADRPRTALAAVESGARAGSWAARAAG